MECVQIQPFFVCSSCYLAEAGETIRCKRNFFREVTEEPWKEFRDGTEDLRCGMN